LFDEEEELAIMTDMTKHLAVDVYSTEGEAAAKLVGFTNFAITADTMKAIEASMQFLSKNYNDTTIKLLTEKLAQGQADGLSIDQLKELVNQLYDFSNTVRAGMVARTETFRIGNGATREAWRQSGVVKSIKWYTAEDEKVCDICAPMDGKTVGIDQTFGTPGEPLIGADGEPVEVDGDVHLMSDYGDGETPQDMHTNCRCYIRPEEISLRSAKPAKVKKQPVDTEKIINERVAIETEKIKADLKAKQEIELKAMGKKIDDLLNE
jgi:SPP1 gp7 family putative phage head morphogenesis protein